jgi:hypothetical protein
MEELITKLILVGIIFTLDFKDPIADHAQVAAYYEVEKSSNITELRPGRHPDLHTIQKEQLTGKRVFH